MMASGAPSGLFVAFGGNAGYRYEEQTDRGLLRWGPVGEIRFNNVAIDGYSESGLGSLSSRLHARDANSLQTGIGAEAAIDMAAATRVLTPHIRATSRHHFADT